MGMMLSLNNDPNVIPIHDAIVMSALDARTKTRGYNKDMFLLAKHFNVFE